MYLGKPGYKFNGGCILLRQQIVETGEVIKDDRGRDTVTVKSIVLAFTGTGSAQPFVTWNRWVTFEMNEHGYSRQQTADTCSHGHYFRELTAEVVADFERRVEDITHDKQNEEAIRQRGLDDGASAASWLIDGNTNEPFKVLTRIVEGIENGDPEVLDQLPQPRVGGEFAGEPTWEDICQAEIERYSDDGEDGLFQVYLEAFDDGVHNEITRMWDGYRPDWSKKS